MNSPRDKRIGLYGEAGTGKTYLLQQVSKNVRIAFTAPTNKAVNVLIEMGCNQIDCMTIYSFLGLVVNEYTGVVSIDKKGECKSTQYDVLVIDEGSMVDDIICSRVKRLKHIKIVIVGDEAQLFPVNLNYSPAFSLVHESITLTEQMRQTNVNHPIRPLLALLRTLILSKTNIIPDLSKFSGQIVGKDGITRSVIIIRKSDNFISILNQMANKLNTKNCSAIAYRNVVVDNLNDLCHQTIYPNAEFIYSKNESLILQRPYKLDTNNTIVMNIGDIIDVEDIEPHNSIIKVGSVKFEIPSLVINNSFVAPQDRIGLNSILTEMGNQLAKGDKSFTWKDYYKFRDTFIHVKHSYCLTAHQSQGSSYDTTVINTKDILSMPGTIEEKLRCLYTALSRTKFNTIILV